MDTSTARRFRNRLQAGRLLAERLREYGGREDVLILGLPRGGIPVAFEIANALKAPLDVLPVRKLGVPSHKELALGAIASGGTRVLNKRLILSLGISPEWIEAIETSERLELQRRELAYRAERPHLELAGKTIILADDGLATGLTMLAAINAVRHGDPAQVLVAVPVAGPHVCASLSDVADEVVCLSTPQPLRAIGAWYEDFSQTTDEEVRELLTKAARFAAAPPQSPPTSHHILTPALPAAHGAARPELSA
ncbi:MAG TPA: phosphoribosyltransferase [Solirubrobacteraceae bacterium]|jgi:putative phosphoribosyl transferase